MELALNEAKKALKKGEVPIGAVIVKNGEIISKAHNQKEQGKNVTKHAEILAITKASKKLNNWRLNGCDMYITLFPCPMCASAIQQARIHRVYYALNSSDELSTEIVNKIFSGSNTNKPVENFSLYGEEESLKLLQNFFQKKR